MAFADFPEQQQVVQLLQRSLQRNRLGHAYLFTGDQLRELEAMARALAKTLNCQNPPGKTDSGLPLDSCDACPSCRKIEQGDHPDVHWIRPESKLRVITVDQMRELMHQVQLRPFDGEYKVAVLVAADRLNPEAGNAFLKTLEEPPAKSVIILLSTESQRMLETLVSRCLRLNFAGESWHTLNDAQLEWLDSFSRVAAENQNGLLDRYRLLGHLRQKLADLRRDLETQLTRDSPLERYADAEIDSKTRDRWAVELAAAIEAEYRHQRTELMVGLQWWLRDVWLWANWEQRFQSGGPGRSTGSTPDADHLPDELLSLPQTAEAACKVARRITPDQAADNLQVLESTQRLLGTNVQEALTLEVGLLKLKL
jgi:DNA polymerase-3 subunit delta'